jgi:hypothetical protein
MGSGATISGKPIPFPRTPGVIVTRGGRAAATWYIARRSAAEGWHAGIH